MTQFSDDPLDVALKWQAMGAPRIHIVDLDGAANGHISNGAIVENIASVLQIHSQLGGGIRDLKTIETILRLGIERVVLGTAAVENRPLVEEACKRFNDYIVVSLDARNGLIATHGWRKDTAWNAVDLARSLVKLGVKRFIYTDIIRDGTLTEPNFTAVSDLINTVQKPVVAAGGVCSILHLKMLSKLGAEGAIIGKALYTGDINLKEAMAALHQ